MKKTILSIGSIGGYHTYSEVLQQAIDQHIVFDEKVKMTWSSASITASNCDFTKFAPEVVTFYNCSFTNCDMMKKIYRCVFRDCTFEQCYFPQTEVYQSSYNALFTGCRFPGSDLRRIKFSDINRRDCDFTRALRNSFPPGGWKIVSGILQKI